MPTPAPDFLVRKIPSAPQRLDLVELAVPCPTDLALAREIRGKVPVLRWRHVALWAAFFVGTIVLVALYLRQIAGPDSSAGAGWVIVLFLFVNAFDWLPWSVPDPRRPRDLGWSFIGGLGIGIVCWLAAAPIAATSGIDHLRAHVVIAVVGPVIGLLTVHVGQALRRAVRLARREPHPVVTSSPGVAVLLALDSVGDASPRHVSDALVTSENAARSWLQVLAAKGLVRGRARGRTWSITRQGRRLLDETLSPGSAQP